MIPDSPIAIDPAQVGNAASTSVDGRRGHTDGYRRSTEGYGRPEIPGEHRDYTYLGGGMGEKRII